MRREELRKVRWHRIVDLGRCSNCTLYVFKSMTSSEVGWLNLVRPACRFHNTSRPAERKNSRYPSLTYQGRPAHMVPAGERAPLAANVPEAPVLGRPPARRSKPRHRALRSDGWWGGQRRCAPALVRARLGAAKQSPQGCVHASCQDHERLGPWFREIACDPIPGQLEDGAPFQHVGLLGAQPSRRRPRNRRNPLMSSD